MVPIGLLVVVFWTVVVLLWIVDGPKWPLIFIGLWLLGGFFISGYLLLAYQGGLAVILYFILKVKEVT